jgi:hypothetical protein
MAHPTARPRRTLLRLVIVTAIAASTACGTTDDGGEATSASTSSASSSSSGSSSSTSSSSSSTSIPPKKRNVIAWILSLGAGSPPGPATAEFAAYQALRRQKCDTALTLATDSGRVFSAIEAAAKACVAARTGNQTLWAQARAQRDDLEDADLDCLQAGVFGLLDRLVDAHAAHPDRVFEFSTGQSRGAPPCPVVTGLEPAHGSAGQRVAITGRNLQYVKLVIVDLGDQGRVCFETPRTKAPTVIMPAPQGATSARVIVVAAPAEWEMGAATFRYDPPATDSPTTDSGSAPTADCP